MLAVHKTLIPIALELGDEVGKFSISISHMTLSHDYKYRVLGLRLILEYSNISKVGGLICDQGLPRYSIIANFLTYRI